MVQRSKRSHNETELQEWLFNDFPISEKNNKNKLSYEFKIDKGEEQQKEIEPAWIDDADQDVLETSLKKKNIVLKYKKNDEPFSGLEYTISLRDKYKNLNKNLRWSLHHEKKTKEPNSIMSWSGSLMKEKVNLIDKTRIDISREKDANIKERSFSYIHTLQFHPNSQILMTGGFDKTIRFYSIDGKNNELIQKMHFSNFPIHSASFTIDGSQLFCSSKRPFFYSYDIESGLVDRSNKLLGRKEKSLESMTVSPNGQHLVFLGESGSILLVDIKTMQLIHCFKMNGTSRSVSFNSTGSLMYSFGDDGSVYAWDMTRRACIHRFQDKGCINGTIVSSSSNYICCGSKSGIVNIYDINEAMKSFNPTPLKSIMNLVTESSVVKMNHDSQLMVVASKFKKDHLKLIHMESQTVYQNWPTEATPLSYVQSVDFSPSSSHLAIGNNKGHALLYRLKGYNNTK